MDDIHTQNLLWLPDLMDKVRAQLTVLERDEPNGRAALEAEFAALEQLTEGWLLSLGNRDLCGDLRVGLEGKFKQAQDRKREIQLELRQEACRRRQLSDALKAEDVHERLDRLADVLAAHNPTTGNLELSMHVDRIVCYSHGRVDMRTCQLGALAGVADLLAEAQPRDPLAVLQSEAEKNSDGTGPRRRTRLRVHDPNSTRSQLQAAADFAADPTRFAGLGEEWFWVDSFQIPKKLSWAAANATNVQTRYDQLQQELGRKPSLNVLAREFGKSRPTITAALKAAAEGDANEAEPSLKDYGTPTVDAKSLADEFARLEREEGLQLAAIAKRFCVHRNTVARVLNEWYRERGLTRKDGRSLRWGRAAE